MKSKTAIAQVLDAANTCTDSSFLEWVKENAPFLLDTERGQIVDAWIEGNREGWEQSTDWPEHGVRYYNRQYSTE
jgi:hypothetical protein